MSERGHGVGTSMMEVVVAGAIIEAVEEELVTVLAESHREKGLAGKVVLYRRGDRELVDYLHRYLVALEGGDVRVH